MDVGTAPAAAAAACKERYPNSLSWEVRQHSGKASMSYSQYGIRS